MKIGTPENCTRVLGEAQGYQPLPIADVRMPDGTPLMCSVWHPTPEELKALNGGGHVVLSVVGITPPPVMLHIAEMDGTPVADKGAN